jgi:hypothetical protein
LAARLIFAVLFSTAAYAHFDGAQNQPCDNEPPISARLPVDVPVYILKVPGSAMFTDCRKQPKDLVIYGCTFLPTKTTPGLILLNGDQDQHELACTLLYERAHLPPNNWWDAKMEATSPNAEPQATPAVVLVKSKAASQP